MSSVYVDPDGLDKTGKDLNEVAERFKDALEKFTSRMEGHNAPWGNDDIGSLIGVAHDEVLEAARESWESAVEAIDDAGVDLGDFAKWYQDAESRIISVLKQAAENLE